MLLELNGYSLENLPPDNIILCKGEVPEVVGYVTLAEALSKADPKILHTERILKFNLRKELLVDGVYIPLPYETKHSGKVVLVFADYDLILEQFYANFVLPLGLSTDSVSLFAEKFNEYIGNRAELERQAAIDAKLADLAIELGVDVATLKAKVSAVGTANGKTVKTAKATA